MAWDVVGVGASCIDHVCRLPVFPQPTGELSKVRIQSQERVCGGQTATTLATCASFGLRTAYVGIVGDDEDGRRIRAELGRRGIAVDHVVACAVPTASATILIDGTGERLVLWHRDASLSYPLDRLPREALTTARVVHVDDVDLDAAIASAQMARAAGVPVTCDIDHVTPGTETLVRHVSHPVFAERVALELTGEHDQERALKALRRSHPGLLVVTLGEAGAIALDGDTLLRVPACRVDPVDTTGAGDVFRGGLIYAIVLGLPARAALAFANASAAVSTTKPGAMGGVPTLADVQALMVT